MAFEGHSPFLYLRRRFQTLVRSSSLRAACWARCEFLHFQTLTPAAARCLESGANCPVLDPRWFFQTGDPPDPDQLCTKLLLYRDQVLPRRQKNVVLFVFVSLWIPFYITSTAYHGRYPLSIANIFKNTSDILTLRGLTSKKAKKSDFLVLPAAALDVPVLDRKSKKRSFS